MLHCHLPKAVGDSSRLRRIVGCAVRTVNVAGAHSAPYGLPWRSASTPVLSSPRPVEPASRVRNNPMAAPEYSSPRGEGPPVRPPGGTAARLSQGTRVRITQALGGSFTVATDRGY